MESSAVRTHVTEALHADLVGPFGRGAGEAHSMAAEVLSIAPSRWYLTGFLAPREHRDADDDPTERDDELGLGDDKDDSDTPAPDPTVKRRVRLPASIGLSVFVPTGTTQITASLSWADYVQLDQPKEEGSDRYKKAPWSRLPHQIVQLTVPLNGDSLSKGLAVPGSNGLQLEGQIEKTDTGIAVAVFLVNAREATLPKDKAFAFQVRLELECTAGFVGRSNATDETSDDTDERILDLQYRRHREYAVGHGISVDWDERAPVTKVASTWFPKTTSPRVEPTPLDGVTVEMEKLAELTDGAALKAALSPMVAQYRTWIAAQKRADVGRDHRAEVQQHLVAQMERAEKRIAAGIELLGADQDAMRAFSLANRAMAIAQRKRSRGTVTPAWRLFQLAFVLMNLPGIADEKHPDRRTVELIFFPTGGGKTEAYLGLIAFMLVLRRLRGAKRPDGGLGVTVILRYTLRLLTLDQLGRAATLICALELLRKRGLAPGDTRYSIGLWVGRSATANTLEQAAKAVTEFKNDTSPNASSPFPLTSCPWCTTPLNRDGFVLRPTRTRPEEIAVGCSNIDCDFTLQKDRDGLPVLFVDEQIYRELPSFLISTVDKFALLPWRGETGMLFGRAHSRDGKRFYGPCDGTKAGPTRLPTGLVSPELIIQDELHLISGPLGSMVGLYEAAIDQLCPGAKLVASTATVRRARQQIQRLYGRDDVAVFPPTGLDPTETFFSRAAKGGERQYLGVAAPGRPMKTILLRVYVSLLAAAYREHDPKAERSPADPYLTLVGYFNSLRELGGMRRLVEDEVRRQASRREERRPVDFPADEAHPWYRSRNLKTEPVELTSREKTAAIAWTKTRLEKAWGEKDHVDVLLASNMISVGVDIDRLGLMVIAGQPKTTSEYIQSSSRVGRRSDKPGLVVTVFNVAKPRDRSHFERFTSYHRSFYRFVEATSVTPWSAPALDRGLAGVTVAAARLANTEMTPSGAVMSLHKNRKSAEALADAIAKRAAAGIESESERARTVSEVRARLGNLLDAWERIIDESNRSAAQRSYSTLDEGARGKSLIFAWGDDTETRDADELKFQAPLSMRDVEPSVHLWVQRQQLGGRTNG